MKKIIIAGAVLIVIGTIAYFLIPAKNSIEPVADPATAITINIKNYSFGQPQLTVKVGTKVTWINNDSVPHTVTSSQSDVLNSAELSTGESFSATLSQPGRIDYHCNIHPSMTGSIVVVI